jgi:hypothetical protein
MITTDTPTLPTLSRAATTIRNAATGDRTANPRDLAAAHNTLAQQRHNTAGTLRDAIDTYLADETWHQGPFALLNAINTLTHQLGLPNPDTAHIVEQLPLFNPD